jgi:hypothetical protein
VGTADVIARYKAQGCTEGTWKDGGCDRTGSVGGCETIDASLGLTTTQWAFSPYTTDVVKQTCQAPSTFLNP